ncbi:unnamed protein product [Closterium sp. Naga37s-1]|nr:unnamed protein product [Closterium sp. Naga37s-1]
MTCEVFELKELVGDGRVSASEKASFFTFSPTSPFHQYVPPSSVCLLHTIMFHRALGLVRPKSIDSELFDITYVQCGDAEVERQIEEKIGQFSLWLEKNPTKKGQICLSFFEKRRPITSSSSSATSSGGNTAGTKSGSSSKTSSTNSSSGGGSGNTSGGSGGGSTRKDAAASWLSASAARLSLGSDKITWEQWIIPVSLLTSASAGTSGLQPSYSSSSSSSSSSPAHSSAAHTTVPTTTAPSTTVVGGTLPSPSPSHSFPPTASNAAATNFANASRPSTGLSITLQQQQQGQQGQQQQQRSMQLEASVREALLSILTMANEKRDHLPPVLTSSLVSFPFEISVPSMSDSFGMDVLKRMLQTAPHHVLG